MPMLRGGRALKRWRYVGVFSPEMMLTAADVHVGPLRSRFWSVARPDGSMLTRSSLRRGTVDLTGEFVRISEDDVDVHLTLDEDAGVETVHRRGRRGYVWTRKQAGVAARGSVRVDGREHLLIGRAVIDDTAGYHERHTRWVWSAGVGVAQSGEQLAWNLVSGVNDEAEGSERAIWVDGSPSEVAAVDFAADLSAVHFADGSSLQFSKWSEHEAQTNLLLVRSRYRQPFGTFSGELPCGRRLKEGYGVMESHDAYW